jgi:hypothetical protein
VTKTLLLLEFNGFEPAEGAGFAQLGVRAIEDLAIDERQQRATAGRGNVDETLLQEFLEAKGHEMFDALQPEAINTQQLLLVRSRLRTRPARVAPAFFP